MKLSFIGDIQFRGFEDITYEQSKDILSEVEPELEGADYIIANLETPLADKEKYSPIPKSGPNHIYPPECISFLDALGADVAILANNHTGDYGDGALKDTQKLLDCHNILHTGAGENIYEAYKSVQLKKDGLCVSLIAVCENEFGLADDNKCGTAAYRPRLLYKAITAEKQTSDFVIVIFHGGNEHNPLPSPDTAERYRMLCDMGADGIVGIHPHRPQGYEIYDGKPIIYSLGNFMFQSRVERDSDDAWFYGYILQLDITKDKTELSIVPYRFDKTAKIKVFKDKEKEMMLEYINKLNDIIADKTELHKHFMGWCFNHSGWFVNPPPSYGGLKNRLAGEYNLMSCEAHHSLIKESYRLLNAGEEDIAKEYGAKISKLSKIPV